MKWPCALTFSAAGIAGAFAGSSVAMEVPGDQLLSLFGVLMLVVGSVMFFKKDAEGNPDVRLSFSTVRQLLPLLLLIGFSVGALSGFFGIGGGFLIVPGLMLATGMPISNAIGTSLVAVTAFGATAAANFALAGLVDWRIAALFIGGGVLGSIAGSLAGRRIAKAKGTLAMIFAVFVILTGLYIVWKGLGELMAV